MKGNNKSKTQQQSSDLHAVSDERAIEMLREIFSGRRRTHVNALLKQAHDELKEEGLYHRAPNRCDFCEQLGHTRTSCRALNANWHDLDDSEKEARLANYGVKDSVTVAEKVRKQT